MQIKSANISHSQILIGEPDNISQHANFIAKSINCSEFKGFGHTHASVIKPCGLCLSCRVFDSGNHPDTFYVSGNKTTSIGVDDVRDQIIVPMSTKPFSYNYKVFIINNAEILTHAAQSALLKTIEEPAPYGFFMFLASHIHNFLPTVISRCHVYRLQGAVTSHDKDKHENAISIIDNVHKIDIIEALALYRIFETYKESKDDIYEFLDVLYSLYGDKITDVVSTGQVVPEYLLNATTSIVDTKKILSQNGNTQLAIELLLIKLTGKG